MDRIAELRKKIDSLDQVICEALEKRASVATQIGEEKRRGGAGSPGFYDPEREARILKRVAELSARSGSAFPPSALPLVFREIFSACRSLESAFKVAYLGPEGTYTQIAAGQAFGHSVEYLEAPTIEGVFDAIQRGQAEYGVVPLENSAEGGVAQTLDALARSTLSIRGEAYLSIEHCLMSAGAVISEIKRVYSHPQALAQCRRFLAENLPGAGVVECRSTAAAALEAQKDPSAAAIASRKAAEVFGLKILREGLQDSREHQTRFAILARADAPRTGDDVTALRLVPKVARGGGLDLVRVLEVLQAARIPVLRWESRAKSGRSWRSQYFVDISGHRTEKKVSTALTRLARLCEEFQVLGSFAKSPDRRNG